MTDGDELPGSTTDAENRRAAKHPNSRLLRRGRDVQMTLAANFISLAIGVATGIMTARALQPHDRGTLTALVLWQATVSSFSLTALDQALILHARGDESRAYGLRRALRRFTNRQASISTPVLLGIALFIVARDGTHQWLAAISIAAVVWLNNYLLMSTAPLRATQRFVSWNLIRLAPQAIYGPSIFVLWLTDTLTVNSGILSLVASNIFAALMGRIAARHRPSAEIARSEIRETRRFGLGVFASMIPRQINLRLDQLMLGLLLPSQYLGIYAVAVSISQVVQTLGNTIEQILFPRFVIGTIERRDVARMLLIYGAAACAMGFILAFAARFLVPFFYGLPYEPAIEPLDILLAGAVFLVLTNVLNAEAKSENRPTHLVVAQWSGVAVTMIGLPILASLYGLNGAAWASAMSYLATCALLLGLRFRAGGQRTTIQDSAARGDGKPLIPPEP